MGSLIILALSRVTTEHVPQHEDDFPVESSKQTTINIVVGKLTRSINLSEA